MATIAVCPACQTQLGVPPEAATGAQLQCPLCQQRFAATPDRVRILAMANLAPAQSPAAPKPAITIAPLSLPPDAALTSQSAPASPAAEKEVDFDIGVISATTPIASQPTVSWEPELPAEEPRAPSLTATETKPADARVLAGDWSNLPSDETPSAPASRLPEPVPAHAAHDLDDSGQSELNHADFEHDELQHEDVDDDAVHAMDFDRMEPVGAAAAASQDFDLQPAPRPRRRRSSPIGTLVGIVGGGGIGLLLAGYALLWLTDPPLDLFQMAAWAPTSVLPNSLVPSSAASQLADEDATRDSAAVAARSNAAEPENTAERSAPDTIADLQTDPAVTPASASEPVASEPTVAPVAPPVTARPLEAPSRWPSTPIIGDLVAPKYFSLADFTASIGKIDAAGRQFLAGDLADKESVRAMGQAYVQMCEAAERYTLTDPADYGADLFTKQALAKSVLRQVAGNTKRRQDLNIVAARWWLHAKRSNNGLLLVGRVTDHQPRGLWTEHTLEIAVGGEVVKVPVLMERVLFSTGAEAAVAGAIVANPRDQLRGYEGTAPQVLVAGTAFDPALYANESTGEDKVLDPLTL